MSKTDPKQPASPTSPTPIKSTARIPDRVVSEQLARSMGNVSHAAKSLGLNRSALHERISRTPKLAQIVSDAREAIVDAAENALYSAVVAKEGWAVCFTLKTIGKGRGYVERQEHRHEFEWDSLTDDELARIAAGEQPAAVLTNRRAKAT